MAPQIDQNIANQLPMLCQPNANGLPSDWRAVEDYPFLIPFPIPSHLRCQFGGCMKNDPALYRYLNQLFADARHVELRHQLNGHWHTRWFSNSIDLIHAAEQVDHHGNLFTSLNHVPHLLGDPVGNDDVSRFCRLLFDFDPVRPKDTSSNRAELEAARDAAKVLLMDLGKMGWPAPAMALSGNGFHLQHRCALPNDSETREALNVIYKGLKADYSTDQVEFDTSVKNAGRICCLYGSTKRKGDHTPERPHRVSRVKVPHLWQQVNRKAVFALADHYARKCPQRVTTAFPGTRSGNIEGKGDYSTLDVVAWFKSLGFYHGPITGNMHAVICPWSHEHSTASPANHSDTVIFESDGSWPGFHCKHGHCQGRTIRDVIQQCGNADIFCGRAFLGVDRV